MLLERSTSSSKAKQNVLILVKKTSKPILSYFSYPHMLIGKLWIYRLISYCLFVFCLFGYEFFC